LRAYNPVEKEPKNRFSVMIKLVTPLGNGSGRLDMDEVDKRKFPDSVWVAFRLPFKTLGNWGDDTAEYWEWHSTA
jgi:hypothetical protein